MKYWFFDGSDVTGPFTLKELAQNKSFSETSLVCPENFSDDGDHWQVASTFADLKPLLAHSTQSDDSVTFDQEIDTLLKERSPLLFEEVPTDGPGLEIPKKPAKPGPIEDYFDRIKEEDLGDILGIPNPNENSDMDLAHALEKQLAKTSSTRRRERERENETDEQTVTELRRTSETHHIATATEVFATKAPVPSSAPVTYTQPTSTAVLEKAPGMPLVESPTMPTLTAEPAPTVQPTALPENNAIQPVTEEAEELVTTQDAVASQEQPAPETEPTGIIPDPAQLRREKVEVNSIRARLKQTQEMKDFLHETQNARLKREAHSQRRIIVMLLAVLAIVGGLFLAFELRPRTQTTPTPTTGSTLSEAAQELLTETTTTVQTPAAPAIPAPVATVNAQTSARESKALEIVQNYQLSGQRGTLAAYLNRIYQAQLAQGYSGTWAAEPLYKNTYIVKYRLTKTRKEPIIYVFQADVAQGKLTGALNNISLDLVGKL